MARATGMAISTVRKGRDEARRGATPEDVVKVRRSVGKRPYEVAHPEVWPALENLNPITRGDPESPLRWTCKSTHALSAELLVRHGIRISHKTVAKLLRDHGYSLQAPNKSVEGAQHPDREQENRAVSDVRRVIGSRVLDQPSDVVPRGTHGQAIITIDMWTMQCVSESGGTPSAPLRVADERTHGAGVDLDR